MPQPVARLARHCFLLATLAFPATARSQDPSGGPSVSRFAERKAEALLRDRLPCLGCHRLNGEGGTIGPDLTSVRERRSPEYIAAMIEDPQRVVPGSAMPRILMPNATRDAITRYLASRPGNGTESPVTPPVTLPDRDGATLYAAYCAACHGASGKGDGPNSANLPVPPAQHASREAMSPRPDDSLYDTIAAGGEIMGRSPRMPAYGATLTPAEIRSLVRHIRTLCRCEGPAWSRPPGGAR